MKKLIIIRIALCFTCFLAAPSIFASEEGNKAFDEIKSELERKGMSSSDIVSIEKPVKDMLEKQGHKEEIKKTLIDLKEKGMSGTNLKGSVNAMSELVNKGESIRETCKLVSSAAHQAKLQGLKGKDLAAKVHEAIAQRKTKMAEWKKMHAGEKEAAKQQMKMNKDKSGKGNK